VRENEYAMATTPRHHLVPQLLLRRFADADGNLRMVRRDDLTVSLGTSVRNACNEAGFYRIETEDLEPDHRDGHDPEFLEKILSTFESRAEIAIEHVLNGSPPWSKDDRYHLTMFTALQYVRGWRFRQQMDDLGTLVMRRELASDPEGMHRSAKQFLRSEGRAATPEAIDEFITQVLGPSGPRLVSSKPNAIQTGIQFALEVLAPMLFVRPMRLLHFADDARLLTSDSPVVTWSPDHPDERVVALDDSATITLPLSPTAALSFARHGQDAAVNSGLTRARQINTAAADIADRWIYHQPSTNPLHGLTVPPDKPKWVDERVASRVDADGTYKELLQTVQR
jgi:hypothetical protein